jgi:predicted PurR-regulated permease PerM
MIANRFYSVMLFAILLVLTYLSYQIIRPFLVPVAWAVVLSIVFYPLYAFCLNHLKWKPLASFVSLVIIMFLIIGPFSYIVFLLVDELKAFSDYAEQGDLNAFQNIMGHPHIKAVIHKATAISKMTEEELNNAIVQWISSSGKDMMSKVTTGIGNIAGLAIDFIFMSFAIFFLLKDGAGFLERARNYMPFSEEQKDRLVRQIKDIVVSTIYGGVAVALVQGAIGGIAYFFLQVPSPVIWGVATAIASFIPLLGAFAVWGPVAAYLFISGFTVKGIILIVVGIFGISMIDNILKPIIIGSRTKMPILAIFFSVLGGIKLFGLIGLITGPLVLALFISVFEIFRNIEDGNSAV